MQKPTGKGERLVIINAISSAGWVKNAKLVFQAKRKTGDYHGQMNSALFQKWFAEKLIPNIESNSLVIMDNASYHNTLVYPYLRLRQIVQKIEYGFRSGL